MTGKRSERGFTLLEAVVVMAIVSIMAGVMIPMLYRVWQSSEEELTRQRMRDLKTALVGDSRLIQNGARTHYGYVGDVGQLASSLANLVSNVDAIPSWDGPYLPPGYDPAVYDKDAWGGQIDYVPAADGSGRLATALLRSNGPDGSTGTADDITDSEFQIAAAETLPASVIGGNLAVDFAAPPLAAKFFYIGVTARYRDGAAALTSATCCDPVQKTVLGVGGNTQVNYSLGFACTLVNNNLPAGRAYLSPALFSDNLCANPLAGGGTPLEIAIDVNTASLFARLQIQNVTP